MEKERSGIWLGLKFKIVIVFMVVLIVAAGVVGFKICTVMYEKRQPQITTTYISGKIDSVSELTTAQMEYKGLVVYSDGNIPFLTKKGFSMIYTAKIRAGVDVSQIEINVTDEQVIITVPDAVIQSVDVDPNSIEFYDEKYALFNWSDKEDVVDTLSVAKEDATANADATELIENANAQTSSIIRSILEDSIGDKELVIR